MTQWTMIGTAAVLLVSSLAEADEGPSTMFGGQLVRPTTLAGSVAVELGGGGALYATERLYWGGGGGTVFQVGDSGEGTEVELFHGEFMLGYDFITGPSAIVSAIVLAGIGMIKEESGVFGLGETRLAVRKPLTAWFMLGAHLGYRRAFASDFPALSNADLSGPVVGLELSFTH